MEFDIIELHCLVLWCPPLSLIISLVIETQLQIRHAGKLTVSVDNPNDLTFDDVVGRTDQHGQFFNNIKEKLIFGVFDPLRSPRDNPSNSLNSIHLIFLMILLRERISQLIWLSFDITLQQLDLGSLRISIVHHLVEQFVDDNKVVPDGLLLDILEVAFQDLDQFVKEGEDHNSIVIFLGDGDQIEIVVLVEVEQIVIPVLYDGPTSIQKYLRVYSSYSRIFLLKTS